MMNGYRLLYGIMSLNGIKKYAVIQANHIAAVFRLFFKNGCPTMAAGLSYSSLMAIVPFLTFLFSLLNAFGVFADELTDIQDFLLTLLMPTKQEELLTLFSSFLENTSKLGVWGLALFAVTSVFLLDTVTGAFNNVWGSRSKRNLSTKFTTYVSLIVVGSLLISVGISVSNSIRGLFPDKSLEQLGMLRRLPIRLIPFGFAFCFLSLLYKILPAGYVQSRSAVLGAFWGTLFIELSRYWFLRIANTFIRMSIVYGSLAAVPIFLFWLYVLWLFTLLGLEIAYTHQFRIRFQQNGIKSGESPAARISTGIEVFLAIAQGFGATLLSEKRIVKQFRITPEQLRNYLIRFTDAGLILEVQPPKTFQSTVWAPSKPLDRIRMSEVLTPLLGSVEHKSEIWESWLSSAMAEAEKETVKDALERKRGAER